MCEILIDDGYSVIIHEQLHFTHRNDGLHLWEAGIVLTRYAYHNLKDTSLTYMDLGTGVGLTGIVVSKYANVLLSDNNLAVLENAWLNVKLNNAKCSLIQLDWTRHQYLKTKVDIVLGSDLVYDGAPLQDLYLTVHKMLNSNGRFYLVIPSQRKMTESFLKIMAQGFTHEVELLIDEKYYKSISWIERTTILCLQIPKIMIIVFIVFATVFCSTLKIEDDEYTYTYEEFEEFAYVEVYEEDSDELKFQHDLASEYDDAIQGFGEEAPIYPDTKEDQDDVQGFGEALEVYSTEEDLVAQKGFGGGEDLYQPDSDDNKAQGFGESAEIYKEDNEKPTKGFGDATDIYSDQEEVELIPDMDLGFGEDDQEEPLIKKSDEEDENKEEKKLNDQTSEKEKEDANQTQDIIKSDDTTQDSNKTQQKTQETIKVGPNITIEEDASQPIVEVPATVKDQQQADQEHQQQADKEPDKVEISEEITKEEVISQSKGKTEKEKPSKEKPIDAVHSKDKRQSKADSSGKQADSKDVESKSKSSNKEKKQEPSATKAGKQTNPKSKKSQLLTSNKQSKPQQQLIHHNKKLNHRNKK